MEVKVSACRIFFKYYLNIAFLQSSYPAFKEEKIKLNLSHFYACLWIDVGLALSKFLLLPLWVFGASAALSLWSLAQSLLMRISFHLHRCPLWKADSVRYRICGFQSQQWTSHPHLDVIKFAHSTPIHRRNGVVGSKSHFTSNWATMWNAVLHVGNSSA